MQGMNTSRKWPRLCESPRICIVWFPKASHCYGIHSTCLWRVVKRGLIEKTKERWGCGVAYCNAWEYALHGHFVCETYGHEKVLPNRRGWNGCVYVLIAEPAGPLFSYAIATATATTDPSALCGRAKEWTGYLPIQNRSMLERGMYWVQWLSEREGVFV